MINPQQIRHNILNDMRVQLTEEFDRNFERKAFFTQKWKPRANKFANGSLLIVTGTLLRSIRSSVGTTKKTAKSPLKASDSPFYTKQGRLPTEENLYSNRPFLPQNLTTLKPN